MTINPQLRNLPDKQLSYQLLTLLVVIISKIVVLRAGVSIRNEFSGGAWAGFMDSDNDSDC
jgi:hypothetical protein